jgi:hypothetical protein
MPVEVFHARGWQLRAPPVPFFLLSAVVLAAAPNIGTRVFYVLMTVATGYWLVRSWRAAVELGHHGLVLRGQVRTRRFSWPDIAEATILAVRTRSPLSGAFPYLCLGLRLSDGRLVHFDELAAPARRAGEVEAAVAAIAARLRDC